jgi:CheY-like chemotaxis protein
VPDFREMYPNRAENFCCTGGGVAMSMSEYTPQRLKSAKIKADQLKATGAKTVVTSCHNCVDGLSDVIRHYKLGMKVTQLVNLAANALVIPEKVVIPVELAIPAVGLPLTGFTILVVDDEPDILTFLAAVLEDQGATVFQAADGEQALALTIQEKPDLVTLDLSMPGKNGGFVFEEIRNNPEITSTKVCIITGKPELRRLIYERPVAPPEGYLDKPVDEESLLTNVRMILEKKHPHGHA